MPAATYDAIVLGAGGVGSAAMWRLARRGLRVLGLDRFHPPHPWGSSHGHTRIIRQAYFEHSDYVPLLLESYRLWEELEEMAGCQLKRETGLLEIGPPEGVVVQGVKAAAREHALEIENLDAREMEQRWPAFQIPPTMEGVFERRAGLLHVERCVEACLDAARRSGAELISGVEVHDWSSKDGIVVRTSCGDFHSARLIVTTGAWAGRLLGSLRGRLRILRKSLMWHASSSPALRADEGCPCYLFELPQGVFYGFPEIDGRGVKVAEHTGGQEVKDPSTADRGLQDFDRAPVEAFIRRHLNGVELPCTEHAICFYTMSPDEHFIVDRSPDDSRVAFAAGLSGHGFKFTPVLGQALADLAIAGRTSLPIDFLALGRFKD